MAEETDTTTQLSAVSAQPSAAPQPDHTPPLLGLSDILWNWSALYRLVVPYLRDIPPVAGFDLSKSYEFVIESVRGTAKSHGPALNVNTLGEVPV